MRLGRYAGLVILAIVFALVLPDTVHAQPATKVFRVGVLTSGTTTRLRDALRELGYIEGRNLVLDVRDTTGTRDRVDAFAAELARANADVIVATYPAAVLAAKRATSTIPIVMVNTPDPVQLGVVTSLARPTGNVTGTTSLSVEVSVKQFEILKEALPRVSRIALLWNPDSPWHPLVVRALRSAKFGAEVHMLEVRDPSQFEAAFEAIAAARDEALVVLADPMLHAPANRKRLVELALRNRLPSMGGLRGWAEAGGMMSYWADEAELNRRVAGYVDRILKGARPGDLPIEQPNVYELVVNQTTAKSLAVTLPPALMRWATVID